MEAFAPDSATEDPNEKSGSPFLTKTVQRAPKKKKARTERSKDEANGEVTHRDHVRGKEKTRRERPK